MLKYRIPNKVKFSISCNQLKMTRDAKKQKNMTIINEK